jgi:hypothetical protein
MLLDFYDVTQALQTRIADLEQQVPGRRGRQMATTAGVAGVAAGAAASDQGQSLIGGAARGIGDLASRGAEIASQKVDALELGEKWDSAVQASGEALRAAGGFAVETWHNVADPVTQAAHSVGGFVANYGDSLAANPSFAATTAAITAGTITAVTPQLRQAVVQAANNTSRWGRAAVAATTDFVREAPSMAAQAVRNVPSLAAQAGRDVGSLAAQAGRDVGSLAAQAGRDVRSLAGQAVQGGASLAGQAGSRVAQSRAGQLGRSAMEGMKKVFNHIRSDPRVAYALSTLGSLRRTHQIANEVTQPQQPTPLPKAGELHLPPPGQDTALTGVVKIGEQPAASAVAGGEAAKGAPKFNRGQGQGQDGR